MRITISDLRFRGTFQHIKKQSDGRGGWKKEEDLPEITVWMALSAKTRPIDRERVSTQQQQAGMTYLVTIRYRKDIAADMRIVVDNKLLYIVKNPYDPEGGRRRWLSMECEERRE